VGAAAEPFVSVVITVYNAERYLARCLETLLELEYPKDKYEVVIVDARSKDRTQDIIRDFARRSAGRPEIRLFEKPGSIGVGRNEGVRHARGSFVAVTDGDMSVSKEWLRELLAGFALADRIGAVGGPNNTATQDLASKSVACIPVHGPTLDEVPLLGRNRYRQPFVSDHDWYTNVTRNSMYRKEVLELVGGFAEELISTEDPELNARIHQAGWKTAYNPKAVVRHFHRASLGAFYRQQRHYAYGHADTTRKRPYMRRPKQFLPAAALVTVVVLALLGLALPMAWVALGLLLLAAVAVLLWYGAKAAVQHRDLRLLASAPVFFAAWQLAWAVHYPRRLLKVGRETVLTTH
jgi:cellulose synthase/poly-beta-1,6-N-acetylglucosamine synthase-like glycosyltransferase